MKLALRIGVVSASLIVASGIAIGTIEMPGVDALAIALARVAALIIGVFENSVSLNGAVIDVGGFVAVVAAQCTAVELILVYCAATLVSPVSLGARMWAMLLGASALCALNLVRVVSLLLVGISFPEHFDAMHLVVWQSVMALAGFAMWLFWLRRSYAKEHLAAQASLKSNPE